MSSKLSPETIALRYLSKFGVGPSRTNLLPVKSAPVYTTVSIDTHHIDLNGHRIYATLNEQNGEPRILHGYFAGENRKMVMLDFENVDIHDKPFVYKAMDFIKRGVTDEKLWLPRGGRFYTSDYGSTLKRRAQNVCPFVPKKDQNLSIFDRHQASTTKTTTQETQNQTYDLNPSSSSSPSSSHYLESKTEDLKSDMLASNTDLLDVFVS